MSAGSKVHVGRRSRHRKARGTMNDRIHGRGNQTRRGAGGDAGRALLRLWMCTANLALLLAGVASCHARAEDRRLVPEPQPRANGGSVVARRKPGVAPAAAPIEIIDLRPTRTQLETLWNAEQQAVAACMRARGFEYRPPAFDDAGLDERPGSRGRGRIRRVTHDPLPSGAARRRAFIDALVGPDNGDQTDSCYKRARAMIYGEDGYAELTRARAALDGQIEARLAVDPGYQRAAQDVKACMQGRRPKQRSLAAAISCAASVNFVQRRSEARRQAQAAVIAHEQKELRGIRKLERLALARAQRFLDGQCLAAL